MPLRSTDWDSLNQTRRRNLNLDWAHRKRKSVKKLFVGTFPHSTTESELRTLFEPHDKVDEVCLVTVRLRKRLRL